MFSTKSKTNLEKYFEQFRNNIIGIEQEFESPFGKKQIIYTDWKMCQFTENSVLIDEIWQLPKS